MKRIESAANGYVTYHKFEEKIIYPKFYLEILH